MKRYITVPILLLLSTIVIVVLTYFLNKEVINRRNQASYLSSVLPESTINQVVQARAKKIGYDVLYQSDSNNIDGRDIIVSEERTIGADGIHSDLKENGKYKHWWRNASLEEATANKQISFLGIFKEQSQKESNNYHITITDPFNTKQLTFSFIPNSTDRYDDQHTSFKQSRYFVDLMDYGISKNDIDKEFILLDSDSENSMEKMNSNLEAGDVVIVKPVLDYTDNSNYTYLQDKYDTLIIDSLIIRRFKEYVPSH